MTNPLLQNFDTPFQTPPFHLIKDEHFIPAIKSALDEAKQNIEKIVNNSEESTFENVIAALERSSKRLGTVSSIFFNLHGADTNDARQEIAKEISPMLAKFANDVYLNEDLFIKVQSILEKKDRLGVLTNEQNTLLDKTYKNFVRNGALLNLNDKNRLRTIDEELSKLGVEFSQNVLNEINDYLKVITDHSQLEGLPEDAIEAAAITAREKGKEGWAFTLQHPSYLAVMKYAKNRELRKEIFMAFGSKACKGNERDNRSAIQQIVALRQGRAKLLGYKTHSHFILEERMAKSPEKVMKFLQEIKGYASSVAMKEVKDLEEFAKKLDGINQLERWDYSYYYEKLKKELFNIDDEELKPYFKLENVLEGVFAIAEKLYGIEFKERDDIPKYHPDVKTYEVVENGEHVAVFYSDFFPRDGKRSGAWMTSFRDQYINEKREDQRPHISIVCNFTKPTESKPSLLTFNEVTTLFHEFGHALHGMLSRCHYSELSGTSVFWDFVELPSQIMENWCFEKEALDLFAKHYQNNTPIPEEYVEKIKESNNFHEGYATMRQLSFGFLDMSWHAQDIEEDVNVLEHEANVMKDFDLLPPVEGLNMSCSFGHIFSGGYSSGYYSYKWAEVLDADAFEYFQEQGIFSHEVATKFKKYILSKGGSEHPMELYKHFRGKEPSPVALLKRAGLLS